MLYIIIGLIIIYLAIGFYFDMPDGSFISKILFRIFWLPLLIFVWIVLRKY